MTQGFNPLLASTPERIAMLAAITTGQANFVGNKGSGLGGPQRSEEDDIAEGLDEKREEDEEREEEASL